MKSRFFQAANPVDCARKGPPSLEFPVRREGEELVEDKDEGVGVQEGRKERGEARGRARTLREGGAVEPRG